MPGEMRRGRREGEDEMGGMRKTGREKEGGGMKGQGEEKRNLHEKKKS